MSAQEIWRNLLSIAISEGSQLQSVWHVAFPLKSLQEQNYFNVVLTCALAWLCFEVLLPRRNTRINLAFAYRSECRPQKSWKIRLQKDVHGIAEVQIMSSQIQKSYQKFSTKRFGCWSSSLEAFARGQLAELAASRVPFELAHALLHPQSMQLKQLMQPTQWDSLWLRTIKLIKGLKGGRTVNLAPYKSFSSCDEKLLCDKMEGGTSIGLGRHQMVVTLLLAAPSCWAVWKDRIENVWQKQLPKLLFIQCCISSRYKTCKEDKILVQTQSGQS